MATTAPPPVRSGLRALYAGKDPKPADLLLKMARDGRAVGREQKTRWQENRQFYVGNQNVAVNGSQNQLRQTGAPRSEVPATYNRLRQFTDGRVALLTKERPPYEVAPEDNDADSIDAARQAEKFLAARWGRAGWNIKARLAELAKNGDIDGISWLYVDWDAYAGSLANQQIALRADGSPVQSRQEYETLKAEDPGGQVLWSMGNSERPLGDVCWRVVLPGAISVDPFAVKNFDDARWIVESRIRPREEIEARLGKGFREAVKESRDLSGEGTSQVAYEDLAVDGDTGRSTISENTGVVCHYIYVKPCPDWPSGLHAEIVDRAQNLPLLVEEWKDELPYFCYVPRPDPGHFLRSKGIVDDLKPIQRDFNTRLRYLALWMKKVALAPLGLPIGSLRSDSVFNEEGYYEYHAALGEPHHMNIPSEPTAILTNNLLWMTSEMEKISGVSSYAQGATTPGGPESNLAISGLIQQTEQNMSEMEANFTEAIEWGGTRSLKIVKTKYTIPRTVVGMGVDDAEQFAAFTGAMMRGVGRMRVNGPLMPKSKQIRMSMIAQFANVLGERIIPHLAGLLDGDPTELQNAVEVDRQNEKGAIRELVGLVTNQTAMNVYQNMKDDLEAFTEAMNGFTRMGLNPMQELASRGVRPINLTENLQAAGVDMPLVEDFLNAPIALQVLDDYRKGDAYRRMQPMAKQLLRERAAAFKQMVGAQMAAMAQQQPVGQQQGSSPNPKGAPSPPKSAPNPGGSA